MDDQAAIERCQAGNVDAFQQVVEQYQAEATGHTMNTPDHQGNEQAVLGQKYAFATASLLLGIASFLSLLGLEKGILAVIFGLLALKAQPLPLLAARRAWAKTGLVLGAIYVALVLVIVLVGWRILVGLMALRCRSGPCDVARPEDGDVRGLTRRGIHGLRGRPALL